MRGSASKQKSATRDKQVKIAKESDEIMRKIEQLKEGLSPAPASNNNPNKMGSEGREKWYQYLPVDNLQSFASVSKEEGRHDNYRQSLEQRLEKLFREEKDLLKQRHFANSFGRSQYQPKQSQSKGYSVNKLKTSNSIDNMQRKIRMLQERYKQKEQEDSKRQKQKEFVLSDNKQRTYFQQKRTRIKSQIQRGGTESSSKEMARQQKLQFQIQKLKTRMIELKQSNKQLSEKILQKEEKKKHKQRTKQILLNILHKLEFINIEIGSVKKKSRNQSAKSNKMQEDAAQLMQQFEALKVQYRHLNEQRKSVEKRQCQIQSKLGKFMDPK